MCTENLRKRLFGKTQFLAPKLWSRCGSQLTTDSDLLAIEVVARDELSSLYVLKSTITKCI